MKSWLALHKKIIWILFAALLVRLFLVWTSSFWREHPDILRWKDWGRIAYLYGFADTYTPEHLAFGTYPNNMPPGTLYIVSGMYWVWLQIGKLLAHVGIAPGSNAWVNVVLLTIVLRLPSLVADLLIGVLLYAIGGIFTAALFLFNPAVLFNSSIWGQMDAINNLFFVASVYFLYKNKFSFSAISFACCLLVKSSLFIFLPIYFLYVWYKSKKVLLNGGIFLLTLLVGSWPIANNFFWYISYLTKNATGEMQNITAFAFNFWWVLYQPTILFGVGDITKIVDISLKNSPIITSLWPYVVAIIIQIPVYLWFVKSDKSFNNFLKVLASIAILSFLFLPHMHERYLYPAWPFLALLSVNRELVLLFTLNFLNILFVWHPMPSAMLWIDAARNTWLQWWIAVATMLAGLWSVRKIFSSK